jgi:hypothetical protein
MNVTILLWMGTHITIQARIDTKKGGRKGKISGTLLKGK